MLKEAFSRLDMTYDPIATSLFKEADDATKLDFWTVSLPSLEYTTWACWIKF